MHISIFGIKGLPAFSGPDRVVEKMLEHYPGKGKFSIYLVKPKVGKKECTPDRHYIYVPTIEGKHLKAFVYFALCALHYLVKGKADLIHVHDTSFGLFIPFLRLKGKVKIIGTIHGNPYDRNKWGTFARVYLRFSEWVFVKSCDYITSVADSKVIELKNHEVKNISYIPNGVDDYWSYQATDSFEYEKYGLERNSYILFVCARLDSTKGLHHLIAAYEEGKFPYKLLAVGNFTHDVTYAKRVEKMCETNRNIVLYKDLLTRDTLISVLKNCRLFVFPSEVEAMSMVLLEAISCKVGVVCSDIQENREIVGNDYEFLFNLSTPHALNDQIQRALDSKKLEENANNLYNRCIEKFSWKAISHNYQKIYSDLSSEAQN